MSSSLKDLPKSVRRQFSHVPGERLVSRRAKRRIRKAMRRLQNAQRLVAFREEQRRLDEILLFAVGA